MRIGSVPSYLPAKFEANIHSAILISLSSLRFLISGLLERYLILPLPHFEQALSITLTAFIFPALLSTLPHLCSTREGTGQDMLKDAKLT